MSGTDDATPGAPGAPGAPGTDGAGPTEAEWRAAARAVLEAAEADRLLAEVRAGGRLVCKFGPCPALGGDWLMGTVEHVEAPAVVVGRGGERLGDFLTWVEAQAIAPELLRQAAGLPVGLVSLDYTLQHDAGGTTRVLACFPEYPRGAEAVGILADSEPALEDFMRELLGLIIAEARAAQARLAGRPRPADPDLTAVRLPPRRRRTDD